MRTLLDTNVISAMRQPERNPEAYQRVRRVPQSECYISSVCFGELTFGVERLEPGRRRDELAVWLDRIEAAYSNRILPLDREASRLWGVIAAQREKIGKPLPLEDAQTAAIAKRFGLRVMTRNVRHFDGFGLTIINPWEPGI